MSITSILSDPTFSPQINAAITAPAVFKPETRVPRVTSDPQYLGIAFDYALRLGLSARFNVPWNISVAERAVESLKFASGPAGEALLSAASIDLVEAKNAVEEVRSTLCDAELDIEAAEACFRLANLDTFRRSQRADRILTSPEPEVVDELQALYRIVPWEEFNPQVRLLLNPTFGAGSELVDGADADLIVDDMLIEIKTTVKNSVGLPAIRQLVCYAVLANEFRAGSDSRRHTVKRLGVYLARAGELFQLDLSACITPDAHDLILDILARGGAASSRR